MSQIDPIAKWEPTNLLNGIQDHSIKQAVAETLELAALHLLERWTYEGNIINDYDFLVFPIIRRLMDLNGHRRIVDLRDLCREVEAEWKAMGGKKFVPEERTKETDDMEWRFIEGFTDRNKDRFTEEKEHVPAIQEKVVESRLEVIMPYCQCGSRMHSQGMHRYIYAGGHYYKYKCSSCGEEADSAMEYPKFKVVYQDVDPEGKSFERHEYLRTQDLFSMLHPNSTRISL